MRILKCVQNKEFRANNGMRIHLVKGVVPRSVIMKKTNPVEIIVVP